MLPPLLLVLAVTWIMPWQMLALLFGACTLAQLAGVFYRPWSWRNITLADVASIMAAGLVIGLIIAFTTARILHQLVLWPLEFAVPVWLGCTLLGTITGAVAGVVIFGFGRRSAETTHAPYEVLRKAAFAVLTAVPLVAVAVGAGFVLLMKIAGTGDALVLKAPPVFHTGSVVYDSAIFFALAGAVLVAEWVGFGLLADHFATRLVMALQGRAPLPYVRWLEEMVRLRVLYRNGGGYVFIHGMMRDHLTGEPAP
jgi:hypothetical protein